MGKKSVRDHWLTFSEADVEVLIACWEAGQTVKEIAMTLERPFTNIRNKVRQLQKKGLLKVRQNTKALPPEFLEHTAGAFKLPLELVEYFSSLFSGTHDKILAGTTEACTAYIAQNGFCYYLNDHIKLTTDDSPSGIVPIYGPNNSLILVCKAVASVRRTMSHDGFVSMCKAIANRF